MGGQSGWNQLLASPIRRGHINGKIFYTLRRAMRHGSDIKGTGSLAMKSHPPAPDLTPAAFKKRDVIAKRR